MGKTIRKQAYESIRIPTAKGGMVHCDKNKYNRKQKHKKDWE